MFTWFGSLLDWLRGLSWLEALALSLGLFLVGFFGSLAFVSWVLVQLPTAYFHHDYVAADTWTNRRPILRWSIRIGKNVAGALLVLIGIILSLPGVPGQGILTILIGIMLLDLPGKRRLEQKIVRRPMVLRAVNRLRSRYGKPPFELDEQS